MNKIFFSASRPSWAREKHIHLLSRSQSIACLSPITMTETVPESRPIIDFSNDDDIKQGKWMNDSELIMKGWADAKVAG